MFFGNQQEILITFMVSVMLHCLFFYLGWLSEWLIQLLSRWLPAKNQDRKQEWLSCIDNLTTPKHKMLFAISLIPAAIALILNPSVPAESQASIKDFFPPPEDFYPIPMRFKKIKSYTTKKKKLSRWLIYCDRLYLGQSSVDYTLEPESENESLI